MIKKITIESLFGRFHYDIEPKDTGVTIITGPNGFGKSTVLKIIDALSNVNFYYFFNIEFKEIKIYFDNNGVLNIIKEYDNITFNNIECNIKDITRNKKMLEEYVRYNGGYRYLGRFSGDFYIDRRSGEKMTYAELFNHLVSNDDEFKRYMIENTTHYDKMVELFKGIKDWCGEVRFISEQRLIKKQNYNIDEERVIDVISELPDKLKTDIDNVSSEYSKVSNYLDGSYPKRLFSAKEGIISEQEFKNKLEEVEVKFNNLIKYGLVDNIGIIGRISYNDKFSEALKIYFDDFTQKYSVFEGLIKKLDLFTQIINERLSFKKIKISRQNGFEIHDEDNDNILKLSQLSSGEKQEIVLFYDLIFNTKSELLLLIDEPEISLHIVWQKKFMDDLLKVAKDNNIKIIVATHSPQIINNHWDIQIDLGELYYEQLNKK